MQAYKPWSSVWRVILRVEENLGFKACFVHHLILIFSNNMGQRFTPHFIQMRKLRLWKFNDLPVPCQVSAPVLLLCILKKKTTVKLVWCCVVFKILWNSWVRGRARKDSYYWCLPFSMVKNEGAGTFQYWFHVIELLHDEPRFEIGIFFLYI